MNGKFFLVIIFFINISSLFSYNFFNIMPDSRIITSFLNTMEGKNSFISYVMIGNTKYIVKQKKRAEKKQLAILRDTVAAYIAKDLAIAHQVSIISYDTPFPGKIYPHLPAIILSIAPGDIIKNQPDTIYFLLKLSQKWGIEYSFLEKGLTRNIIKQMTWHEQLPLIIALDLIIGNSDRHGGNLFYDPKTDTFCAIDMDNAFNKDLCDLAHKKLLLMMEMGEAFFSEKEIKALTDLKKHLRYFVAAYTPQALIKKLHYFARKAGFTPNSPLYDKKIETKLALYEEMITKTHASARRLITLLNEIILSCM